MATTKIRNDFDVNDHEGSSAGLKLGGTLITATAAEINILDGVTATTAEINILDGVTATAAEINAAADVGSRIVDIGDNTTYTVLSANSGKVHTVPDLTADIVISLPAVAAGLEYEFVYAGVAADAQDIQLDTGSDTNYFLGGVLHVDDAPAADAVAGDGNSNSKINILTPEPGTRVRVLCDGTNWILVGTVVSANAPTFADQ